MPFSGVHVTYGYPILSGPPIWSETMRSPGATTNHACKDTDQRYTERNPTFTIYTSDDAFFTVGPKHDVTDGPRRFLRAGAVTEVYAKDGDHVAWTEALATG